MVFEDGSSSDSGDEDNDDDEGLNEGQRNKEAKSKAVSSDNKAEAARTAQQKENAQRIARAVQQKLKVGEENPKPSTEGFDAEPNALSAKPGEPIYDRVVRNPKTGKLVQAGQDALQHYAAAESTFEGFEGTAGTSAQAQIATNAAEAGQLEPYGAEFHRAEQASREAEQLEVETAESNGDNGRARRARGRRIPKIAKVLFGVGLVGSVSAAILAPLMATGVIKLGGDDDDDTDGTTAPTPVPGAPDVNNTIKLTALNPAKEQSVDIPDGILKTPDPNADPTSVQLTSSDDDDDNRLTVPESGFFRLDPATGDLTFSPVPAFVGGLVQAGVSIANTAGKRSARCVVNFDFDTRPVAGALMVQADLSKTDTVTVDVLEGTGVTLGDPVKKGTHDIDPRSVIFLMPMPLEGGQPMQGDMTVTGGKTAKVGGEGEWVIEANTGAITFTRDPAFDGSPTPVTFQVYDVEGIPSTVGSVVISADLDTLTKAFNVLNTSSDAVFWKRYEDDFVNGDWDDLAPPSEILAKLTLFRTVHLLIFQITRLSLKKDEMDTVVDALPDRETIDAAYTNWAKARFTTDALYSEAVRISPAGTPASAITNGDRMLRLLIIRSLLGRWVNVVGGIDD